MSAIRVGMIGADLHALYYGAQMFEHDPLHLRSVGRGYAAAFYHYTHYNDPGIMTVPFVGGFQLARVWAAERADAEALTSVFGGDICDSFEQCSDDVDLVFIPVCIGDGADHRELASPGLAKGVPIAESYRGVVPFLVSDFIRTILLLFVPALSLFLLRFMD